MTASRAEATMAFPRIETLEDPRRYTAAQLDRARRLAAVLGRGRLVLCEKPAR